MLKQVRKNNRVDYRGATIVLLKEKVVPHSFGRYIFVNSEDYNSGLVPDEIVVHELTHVRQYHTYDILFIELLISFGWFNPVFYLYRNKIRENHEFLADEAVIGKNIEAVPDYLAILLNYIPQNKKISFPSNFNYLITKKRFVMMTKTTSKKRAWCSNIALIPVFIVAICVFSTKTIAQHDMNEVLPELNGSIEIPTQDNKQIVSADLPPDGKLSSLLNDSVFAARYKEYNQFIEKCNIEKDGKKYINFSSLSKEDYDRMKELFLSMSPEQQAVLDFTFRHLRFEEKIPTKEQYEAWKVPADYGIWLDGKRIENSELNQYQPTNFSYYSTSRLTRTAKNYGKHVYQLNLYTTKYCNELNANETLYLMPNIQSKSF
jgi:hypothetical protein